MTKPLHPENESLRLDSLRNYKLNKDTDSDFDQLTELAALSTGMPISLISIVEKEEVWFKSSYGVEICSSDRDLSFCSFAIGSENPIFTINDTKKDERFSNHPYANKGKDSIIFYSGICLINNEGFKIGTLCVIDNKANSLSEKEKTALKLIANQAIKLIQLNKTNKKLKKTQKTLRDQNENLRNFAGHVSHDMKMPLANMILTSDILKLKYSKELDDKGKKYLEYIKSSSLTLSDYITGLLNHYESESITEMTTEYFSLNDLLEEVTDLLSINIHCEINYPKKDLNISTNRAVLEQILLNLIGNSIKYSDKKATIINISYKTKKDAIYLKVKDNGIGIPKDKLKDVFNLFSTVGNLDRYGNKGHGIGLSTVKKLVSKLSGKIKVKSKLGKGTQFVFSIKQ